MPGTKTLFIREEEDMYLESFYPLFGGDFASIRLLSQLLHVSLGPTEQKF